MACYYPMTAWHTNTINPETGKRGITFNRGNGIQEMELSLPCGKCMGCRVAKSTEWALRCVHESQSHEYNCFLTLTYDDANLPSTGSLVKKHFQNFMKRLRERVKPLKIRYYMCGEYGDQLGRPHYHALIFGYDFPDKVEFKYRKNSVLYTSKQLESLWEYGFCTIGALTYETAAYTAKYATKKIYGEKADDYYQGREPEYSTMSNRPGIGAIYFEQYKNELYQHDSISRNGRTFPLPRFYTNRFTDEQQKKLKADRQISLQKNADNNTIARLRVREKVQESKLKHISRPL